MQVHVEITMYEKKMYKKNCLLQGNASINKIMQTQQKQAQTKHSTTKNITAQSPADVWR